jgi:hypothetical protein
MTLAALAEPLAGHHNDHDTTLMRLVVADLH